MKEIYLDNSATTKPLNKVIDAMTSSLKNKYANPSSLHQKGLNAEKIIKTARKTVADKLRVDYDQIYFTSGGTESNNLAIKGVANFYHNRGQHLITTKIEHASVLNVFQALEKEGFEVTYLKTDKNGIISLNQLKNALRPDTILVSIMQVNNEIGSIQPLVEVGNIIKNYNKNIFFHVDAVQAFGKILIKPQDWQIDLLSISGHKFHGPKGVGALFMRTGMKLKPLFNGGGQEAGLRSGTENVPGLAGLIPAVKELPDFNQKQQQDQSLSQLKNIFIKKIQKKLPQARINTPISNSAPHIINISFPNLKGEVLVHALEEENIYVSTGSACNSRANRGNQVLNAISVPPEYIEGTIRISLSKFNTEAEINYTIDQLQQKVDFLNI